MESKKYILGFGFLIALVFMLSLASATVTIYYNVSDAVWEDDGSLNTTMSSSISGIVYHEGYVCTSVNCTTVGSQVSGLTGSTTSGNATLIYPSNLLSQHGYVTYFYKEGYIGWQQFANWYSPDSNNYFTNSNKTIFLSRKRTAFAPISNFSVYNQVEPNKSIEINFSVGIDANTASAIEDIRIANIPLQEDFEVEVLLRITNSSGSIIHLNSTVLNIPYSENATINFVYPGFESVGDYNITLITNITDAKIINPLLNNATFQIQVIEANLTNHSYSLLRSVSHSPMFPVVNDSVNINFDYLSNFVNFVGGLSALNTSLEVIIERDENFYKDFSFNLPNLSTDFSPSSFDFIVNQTGFYQVHLFTTPKNPIGDPVIGTNATISFFVSQRTNGNETNGNETSIYLDIISPQNITYTNNTILVNIYHNGTQAWFSWNGTVVPYLGPINVSFNNGSNTLQAVATDGLGNSIYQNVTFYVNITGDNGNGDNGDNGSKKNKGTQTETFFQGGDIISLGPANITGTTISLSGEKSKEEGSRFSVFIWLWIILLLIAILITLFALARI